MSRLGPLLLLLRLLLILPVPFCDVEVPGDAATPFHNVEVIWEVLR